MGNKILGIAKSICKFLNRVDEMTLGQEGPDIYCDCGRIDCDGHVQLRKGFVSITHEDGTKEERWDYFYIDAFESKQEYDDNWRPKRDGKKCEDCEYMRKSLCKKAESGKDACECFTLRMDSKDRKHQAIQLMLTPESAKYIMWYMLKNYSPLIPQIIEKWDRIIILLSLRFDEWSDRIDSKIGGPKVKNENKNIKTV